MSGKHGCGKNGGLHSRGRNYGQGRRQRAFSDAGNVVYGKGSFLSFHDDFATFFLPL